MSLQPVDEGGWLAEIVRQFEGNIFFWIRRHASDIHRPVPALAKGGLPWLDFSIATSTFLPILLERADVHLTRFSAVTLEAAGMDVPTIATEKYAADLYEFATSTWNVLD